MSKDRDYYEILGINRSATNSEIEKAYRLAVKKYHPDINKSPDANVRMSEVNAAYEVLSKPDKRSQYDMHLSRGRSTKDFGYQDYDNTDGFQQSGFRGDSNFFSNFSFFEGNSGTGFGFKDIFSNFFGGGSEDNHDGDHDSRFHPGQDIVLSLELTMPEWFNGVTKTISYDVMVRCNNCVKQKMHCSGCKGRGFVGATIYGKIICNICGGSGSRDAIRLCGQCNQGGFKQKVSKTLTIPRFMNQKYTIKGAGHFSAKTQGNGNLVLQIKILAHPIFKLVGEDIDCVLEIGIEEYIYGANLKFKYLDNSFININLLPFSALYLTLERKGPYINNKYGNLNIEFIIKNNIGKPVDRNSFTSMFSIKPMSDNFVQR